MTNSIFPFILVRTAGFPPLSLSADWPDEAALTTAETEAARQVQQAFDAALATLPDSPVRTLVYNARKRFFQKNALPQNGFKQQRTEHAAQAEVTQLLDSLEVWKEIQATSRNAGSLIEQALCENWRSIQQAANNPDFQKALLFASHDLLDRLPAFCAQAPDQFTAKDRQTGLSVMQYLTRGAYKTSPLSRFTTVSLWRWQAPVPPPDLDTPAFLQDAKAVVTPNVALLPALYEVLLAEPAFYQSLTLTLNPCITTVKDPEGWRWLYFDGEHESFQHLAFHAAAAAVIQICLDRQRQTPWRTLLFELEKQIKAEEKKLVTLIQELVALGLLAWQLPERGLTPGWCGGLYNYLGHLPMAPVITEAAALLQWLRTAARTLPFQTIHEAQATQRQTAQQLQGFFGRHGSPIPPMPVEQIFFEDVEQPAVVHIPPAEVQRLADQLADCWRQSAPQRWSPFRSALHACAASELKVGESRPFLDFCPQFLSAKAEWEKHPPVEAAPFSGKIGALLQVFKKDDGSYGAVVNGLFPGGGKLMARWTHLFPAGFREVLQGWFPGDATAFPWQGWSNANFQPALAQATLAVPDGRTDAPDGSATLLGDLQVQRAADGPILVDGKTGRRVWFTDLGLESPTTRPPAMQVLWHLGVPPVSLERLWPVEPGWVPAGADWQYRPRVDFQSLVLRRASWRIMQVTWQSWLEPAGMVGERLLRLRRALLRGGLPAQFFARFYPQKPFYVDQDSPAGLLMLEKVLRGGKGALYCTEMLPVAEQGVGEQVMEFVVEMTV